MRIVKRLPVYATGVALAVALATVADAREWSGWHIVGVGVAVGAFYVLTIFVPWLVREQLAAVPGQYETNGTPLSRVVTFRVNGGNGSADEWHAGRPPTAGDLVALEHSQPHVVTR